MRLLCQFSTQFSKIKTVLLVCLLLVPVSFEALAGDAIASRYDAPEIILADLDGNDVSLSGYRGSVVILLFWTTW